MTAQAAARDTLLLADPLGPILSPIGASSKATRRADSVGWGATWASKVAQAGSVPRLRSGLLHENPERSLRAAGICATLTRACASAPHGEARMPPRATDTVRVAVSPRLQRRAQRAAAEHPHRAALGLHPCLVAGEWRGRHDGDAVLGRRDGGEVDAQLVVRERGRAERSLANDVAEACGATGEEVR